MDRRLVVRVVVHAFHLECTMYERLLFRKKEYRAYDVDLATDRPVGPIRPERTLQYLSIDTKMIREGTHGQVPQPVGMCTESIITKPPVNDCFVVIRMLLRTLATVGVVSTFMTAFPTEFTSTRPADSCVSYAVSARRARKRKCNAPRRPGQRSRQPRASGPPCSRSQTRRKTSSRPGQRNEHAAESKKT